MAKPYLDKIPIHKHNVTLPGLQGCHRAVASTEGHCAGYLRLCGRLRVPVISQIDSDEIFGDADQMAYLMQAISSKATSPSEGAAPDRGKPLSVLAWCLPTLLGIAGFLISFPIDRKIPFLPHANIAEAFCAWFLFVTPAATTVGVVKLVRASSLGQITTTAKWLLLAVITIAVLLNVFLLFGLYAAANF